MNNNNNFNINNWIGTTHLDFFKNSSNALSNYTYNTSNILENDILIYSNISYLYTSNSSNSNIYFTSNTSNIILNRYDPMIENRFEITSLPIAPLITYPTNQVYINNSNEFGEIRFYTKSSSNFYKIGQPFPSEAPKHLVKIDIDGKLKCYYTFDPLLNLTFGSGWVDIITNLIALNADSVNQGTLIGGLEAQIAANVASLQAQISQMLIEFEEEGIILPGQRARIDTELQNLAEGSSVNGSRNTMNELYRLYQEGRRAYTLNRIKEAIDLITLRISQNSAAAFFLGFGGAAFGLFYSLQDSIKHNEFLNTAVKMKINSNILLSSNQKRDLYTSNIQDMNSNTIDQLESNYNINLIQGFTNSNIITQQYLNSINTNEIKISQTNISNIFIASNVLSNINLNEGFLNSNITNQQYISNLKCDNLNLNNGNITAVNTISVNTINISGKVKQFGNYLDDTYLKPEDLYNLSYNYTIERRYPPKAYNTSTTEKSVNLLGTLVYNQTLILDNIGITYGEGQYEIYSSSTYDNGITNKDKLFNFDNTETINTARWAINQYESGTGDYQGNSSIDGVDFGDWIIIKLPLPLLLTKFRFYKNTSFPQLAPSLWKCFGSTDGIEWFEIFQAHNFTRLVEADYNLGYYEKILSSVIPLTTLYNYIGFSFNSLIGTSGATSLNFAELQLFGKEQLSYNIDSYKYTTPEAVKVVVRDDMPDIEKKSAFIVSIPATATYYDGTSSTTYYKYDLDLRLYTKTGIIPNTTDLMRIFKIRFFYTPAYFGSYIDNEPYVNSYEVYMSYKQNPVLGQPSTAGLNIYAVGFPTNVKLANILPNQLMLLRNVSGSINYITIVSRTAPANVSVIISDMIA